MAAGGYLVLGCGGGDDVPPHSRSSLGLDLDDRAELRGVNTLQKYDQYGDDVPRTHGDLENGNRSARYVDTGRIPILPLGT